VQLSQIIERLAKLQRVQRLVGYGATYMVVLLLYVFLFYLPKNSDLGTLQTEQANLIKQKQQVEDRVKNKAARDAELQQLNADLTAALKELPNDREIPGLLKGISTLGKKVGLEVKKFQPLPEVKKEYVA
jgi:type IV pilus assembly protein PilO